MVRGIITSILIFGIFGCAEKAPEVKVKMVEGFHVAFIKEVGDYNKVGSVIEELYIWLGEREAKIAGHCFGMYYQDDPEKIPVESLRWEICIPIEAELEGDERVGIKDIPETEVAYLIHKGSYETVGQDWKKLYEWIFRNNYIPTGPGKGIYLNNPKEVPEDSLLTEIQVPVGKK